MCFPKKLLLALKLVSRLPFLSGFFPRFFSQIRILKRNMLESAGHASWLNWAAADRGTSEAAKKWHAGQRSPLR